MKRIFLLLLATLLLFPVAAEAYSFRTEAFVALRDMVSELEDNEDEETTPEGKTALLAELATAVEAAQASIDGVRDGELARLDAAYKRANDNLAASKKKSFDRRKAAIDRWCARAKRGKTEKQKAVIQKTCDKKLAQAQAGVDKWASKKAVEIEKKYGSSARARVTLQRSYDQFKGFVDKYNTRGQASIEARPSPTE